MGSIRIALAQILVLDGDRAGNFVRIEHAIVEAKSRGADIVALPESCVLGWENPDAHRRAHPIPGGDSERLAALAAKHGMHLSVGLDEKDGDRLYGAGLLIDDRGRILLKHRKVHVLPHLMDPPYSAGEGVAPAVETRFGRIGLLVCADSMDARLRGQVAEQKPDLVFIPYGWAGGEEQWPDYGLQLRELVQAAARQIRCTVIGTNSVGSMSHGPWTGHVYGGQSVVADASGRVIACGRDRDRDLFLVEHEGGRVS